MNIFAALFGIFRRRGLVDTVREGRPLASFIVVATVFSVVGSLLYGFAMGIGLEQIGIFGSFWQLLLLQWQPFCGLI